MNNMNMSMGTTSMSGMGDKMTGMTGMTGMGGMGGMGDTGNGMGGMHMGGMPGGMPGMMQMYFHTGVKEYILFETLLTSTAGDMGGACVAIFFLAVLYEGLKVLREHLLRKSLTTNRYSSVTATGNGFSQDTSVIDPSKSKNNSVHILSGSHFLQTFLHMVQVFVSYCLMLVFMTYNAWLCIAVILGAAAGYFLFGWRRSIVVDLNEHCH
ncbi:high affinity copper uptake protein 1-like isoform X2 [Ylistrum balloti]|uniref:high affinity copper uptake protein 1-like isoform X2 n=1 Tax=Ylistrum balloti TaxID=509963 RepID=UPI002905A900|nr:high affinity copper uptake protein 1-like isoform X2 [Ylistrum balloti]